MKEIFSTLLLGCLLLCSAQAAQISQQHSTQKGKTNMVKLQTNHGNITLELDEERAPATVKNFLDYVNNGFYNNTVFHRVIDNFMIQGGGFEPGMREKPTKAPDRKSVV